MIIRENISLKELTTFKAGGSVRFVVECESVEDVKNALVFAEEKKLPWYVLGKGSNIVPSEKGFNGVVLLMKDTSCSFSEESEKVIEVVCGAGMLFDTLVQETVSRSLWGLENLAGIPGTVGAAPVQNIGAYGSELVNTFISAEVFDTKKKEVYRMDKEDCHFSYRESIFKKAPHLIILNVTLRLQTFGIPAVSYADIAAEKEKGTKLETPLQIAEVVRAIRAQKFPDWKVEGTAGSFFKNPVITEEKYQALVAQYGPIPAFPADTGIKIPLAFVLDKLLGLRGYSLGAARLFERQPLVLVLEENGDASAIEILAVDISKKVFDATGITIESEARSLN